MKEPTNHDETSTVPIERYDLRILQSLRRIVQAVDIHSRCLSVKHQVTAPQLITLLAIAKHEPLTMVRLSKEVYLSPSTLVGIIDRLEAKHFVVRERSKQDRRQVCISITPEGRAFAEEAPSPLQETFANALSELSPLEQATISLSLERVVSMMEAEQVDAAPILQAGELNPQAAKKS